MLEMESRAYIPDSVRETVYQALDRAGFMYNGESHQLDVILDDPDGSLFKSGKKIRVRREDDQVTLTFKGSLSGRNDLSIRKELNIGIALQDLDALIELFEALSFPVLFQTPKTRKLFLHADGTHATIDDWPILGTVLELEGSEDNIIRHQNVLGFLEFANFRLTELFEKAMAERGKTFLELRQEYDKAHNTDLGHIEVIFD